MTSFAKLYFIVFGILTIVGGVIGYVQASSLPSLIAGSVAGLILLAGAFLMGRKRIPGLIVVLVASLALAGRFVPVFLAEGGFMPEGLMSVLSVIGLLVSVGALIKR